MTGMVTVGKMLHASQTVVGIITNGLNDATEVSSCEIFLSSEFGTKFHTEVPLSVDMHEFRCNKMYSRKRQHSR